MRADDFVRQMNESLWQVLAVRDAALEGIPASVGRAEVPALLLGALRLEFEAAEIAARWVHSTPELEAKLAFARQAGDEARHYGLIEERLRELRFDLGGFSPTAGGYSRLYLYLGTLETTVERVAAAQFTREAIGWKSNELFIAFCEAAGDRATAEMYRTRIQPDEWRHHEWGRRQLGTLAVGPVEQSAAKRAIFTTLETAEELRSLAAGRILVEALPGC
ncbi:MAG TPA: ferritin-like domain-containing protein [Vicinamibacteria bacterium]|nr:ferritin-like domain-containing protein [Vicinamibacteria bacterium]